MLPKVLLAASLWVGVSAINPYQYFSKRQVIPIPRGRLFDDVPADVDLKWYPCTALLPEETLGHEYECAQLSVPLDYKNPENKLRAIIPLLKYKAAEDAPYKGTVLINPGGPGGMGTQTMAFGEIGEFIENNIVGPGYDIIGFDPRGIGYSTPWGNCGLFPFSLEPDRQNATVLPRDVDAIRRGAYMVPPKGNDEVVYGLLIPKDPPSLLRAFRSQVGLRSAACANMTAAYNQAAPHMNSAVVATDMLSIAKAIARSRGEDEEAALVNYYGISYGTVIGQWFATLYPNRVGKFFLDAVVDSETWISGESKPERVVKYMDKAFAEFFTHCFDAGPTRCPFFTGRTSGAIRERWNKIAIKLNATELELEGNPAAGGVLAVIVTLKDAIRASSYDPHLYWVGLAEFFVDIESLLTPEDPKDWDVEAIYLAHLDFLLKGQVTRDPIPYIPDPFTEVSCTDSPDLRDLEITDEELEDWRKYSRLGVVARQTWKMECTKWTIRPSWEFYGPIGAKKTKTPILFGGNTIDPITPFENGERARKLFGGAKMLYVSGIGHSMLAVRNTCAFRHITAYFQDGILPGHNNRCKSEISPFFGESL